MKQLVVAVVFAVSLLACVKEPCNSTMCHEASPLLELSYEHPNLIANTVYCIDCQTIEWKDESLMVEFADSSFRVQESIYADRTLPAMAWKLEIDEKLSKYNYALACKTDKREIRACDTVEISSSKVP